jgi:hypothetical protein
MHSGPKLNGTMIAKVHIHANSCMVLNSTGTLGQVPHFSFSLFFRRHKTSFQSIVFGFGLALNRP